MKKARGGSTCGGERVGDRIMLTTHNKLFVSDHKRQERKKQKQKQKTDDKRSRTFDFATGHRFLNLRVSR
jgi:hypothetical protein